MGGVEGIEDNHLGCGSAGGSKEVTQALGVAEEVAGGTDVDEKVAVSRRAQGLAHIPQAGGELLDGKFELTDEDPTGSRNLETGARSSCRQSESKVGDEQGFTDLGFAAEKEDALSRE
jgi:hypothetical protein